MITSMPKAPPKLDPADPIHRFALELRRLRIRGGDPSQIKLARAVGCTHSTISAYFNGHRLPGPKQLESLVVACKGNPAQWLEKLEAVHDEIGRIPNSRSPEPDSDSLVTDSHLRPLPSHEYEIETGPTVSARPFGERKIAFDGQEGADVAQLQQHLSRHGFLREKYADGTFDRQTKEALYKFQHDMGIYVDGAPDATTAKVLKFLETLDSRAVDLPDDLRSLVQMVVRSQNMGLIF